MTSVIVFGIVAALLFLLAFLTKRRFGVLGAAVILGYVMQQLWEKELPAWADLLALPDNWIIAPVTILGIVVIMMPSIALLFGGPVYRSKHGRVIGAIGYATLATVCCVSPLVNSLALTGEDAKIIAMVAQYMPFIITAAALLVVVDMFHIHVGIPGKGRPPKH